MRQIKAKLIADNAVDETQRRIQIRSALGVNLDTARGKRFVEEPGVGKFPRYDEEDGFHVEPSVLDAMLKHEWIEYKWLAGEPKAAPVAKPKKRGKV